MLDNVRLLESNLMMIRQMKKQKLIHVPEMSNEQLDRNLKRVKANITNESSYSQIVWDLMELRKEEKELQQIFNDI